MSASSRAPPSEMRADDLSFHRVPGRPLEPRQLALHFLLGGVGELERREALAQLLDVTCLVPLAQLFPDRLHLLAQEQLPLALAQLLLNLRLDVLLSVEHADLTLTVHQHPAHPLLDLEGFEQRLALGRVDLQVAGHEVGETSFFNDAPAPEFYTLSLHDALPIYDAGEVDGQLYIAMRYV